MHVSALKIRAVNLTADALAYIRSMVGREVTARVLRGFVHEGKTFIDLQLAGGIVRARLEGKALPDGAKVYLRVDRNAEGSFQLSVLSQSNSASSVLPTPIFPPTLSTALADVLRRFFSRSSTSSESLDRWLEQARTTPAGSVSQLDPDLLLLLELSVDQRRGSRDEGGAAMEAGLMKEESGQVVFLRMPVSSSGDEIVAAVHSEDDFKSCRIYLQGRPESVFRDLLSMKQDWEAALAQAGPELRGLYLVPDSSSEATGLDIQA